MCIEPNLMPPGMPQSCKFKIYKVSDFKRVTPTDIHCVDFAVVTLFMMCANIEYTRRAADNGSSQ